MQNYTSDFITAYKVKLGCYNNIISFGFTFDFRKPGSAFEVLIAVVLIIFHVNHMNLLE